MDGIKEIIFRRPHFLKGMASCIDLFGILNKNNKDKIFLSDYKAICNDWSVIGDDMRMVINTQSEHVRK